MRHEPDERLEESELGFRRLAESLPLTDLRMPIMDGVTTIRALRRMNPDVRIIAASGLGGGSGFEPLAEFGIRHFPAKPYTADQLLDKVHEVLAGGQSG